jgi:3-dehydroquinate synthetase
MDELSSGLAEVVKAGLIGDEIFLLIAPKVGSGQRDWCSIVRRSAAVKIGIIQERPFEQNLRAV